MALDALDQVRRHRLAEPAAAHQHLHARARASEIQHCLSGGVARAHHEHIITPAPHRLAAARSLGNAAAAQLAAAAHAPEIPFRIVGDGQLAPLLRERPPNVEHVEWIPYPELPAEYQRAGCALGIFGTGEKAARVIPNKVFQALACARPVITADSMTGTWSP